MYHCCIMSGQVVTDHRKIAVNYFKSWFVVDAIAAIPFDLVLYSTGTSDVSITNRILVETINACCELKAVLIVVFVRNV